MRNEKISLVFIHFVVYVTCGGQLTGHPCLFQEFHALVNPSVACTMQTSVTKDRCNHACEKVHISFPSAHSSMTHVNGWRWELLE